MIALQTSETIFDRLAPWMTPALTRLWATVAAQSAEEQHHWWACWDSRQGLYEMALDFWRYDYAPVHRGRLCRLLLTALNCPAALTALEQSVSIMRHDLGLLQSPVNTLSFATTKDGEHLVEHVKFYFDLHRYHEYRDGPQITSHPPADADMILAMLARLGDVLQVPPAAPASHTLLHGVGLRPVLLGASFHPRDPSQRRITLYYGLEDHDVRKRDDVIGLIADHQVRPDLMAQHHKIRAVGGMPVSIAAYADPHGQMDLKIDYRLAPETISKTAWRDILHSCPDAPSMIPTGLGVHIPPNGGQRLKLYFV